MPQTFFGQLARLLMGSRFFLERRDAEHAGSGDDGPQHQRRQQRLPNIVLQIHYRLAQGPAARFEILFVQLPQLFGDGKNRHGLRAEAIVHKLRSGLLRSLLELVAHSLQISFQRDLQALHGGAAVLRPQGLQLRQVQLGFGMQGCQLDRVGAG